MNKHAILSASASARWMNCPGSVLAESGMPEPPTSDFAAEGTAAHALAELCLNSKKPPETYMHMEIENFHVNEEMATHVATYVDFCNMHEGEKFYELRVDYSDYAAGGFGTADCVVIDEGVCHIIDLKYGTGVKVNAQKNSQLMLYALGALHKFSNQVDMVKMSIVQPRLDHIDSYSVRAKDLIKWGEEVVRPAALATFDPNPKFHPSEIACRWCRAKPVCRALAKHNYDLTLSNFDDLDAPLLVQVPHTLTADEIARLVPKMDALIGWARGIQEQAQRILNDGGILSGYKLVEGRTQRKWKDEQEATTNLKKLLGEKAQVTKLVSPAQAEKLLGKGRAAEVTQLWTRGNGRPVLAPESDVRPAIKPEIETLFNVITEE